MLLSLAAALSVAAPASADAAHLAQERPAPTRLERNKRLAREFYEKLWFSDQSDSYAEYVADTYVVHDVGPRKGVTEQAAEQKAIADFFHAMGTMTGEIDYPIAEGDKVATRWWISMSDVSEQGRAMGVEPFERIAIINVFRFDDEGRIVEIWNHRHDVELPQPRGQQPTD